MTPYFKITRPDGTTKEFYAEIRNGMLFMPGDADRPFWNGRIVGKPVAKPAAAAKSQRVSRQTMNKIGRRIVPARWDYKVTEAFHCPSGRQSARAQPEKE